MKTDGKRKGQSFQHATDLQAAYQEYEAALLEVRTAAGETGLGTRGEMPPLGVLDLAPHMVWNKADRSARAWLRLGAAARRVHVAIRGAKDAAQWDGFRPSEELEAARRSLRQNAPRGRAMAT